MIHKDTRAHNKDGRGRDAKKSKLAQFVMRQYDSLEGISSFSVSNV